MTDAPSGRSAESGLRLFMAIALPDAIRSQVATLAGNLQKGAQFTSCRPSWAHPETMHLTLVFLGARPASQVEPIAAAMENAASLYAPLTLEIKGLGVFPNWGRPRVLWAGMRDRSRQIDQLHGALERAMRPFAYEPEGRPYHPHLTLARFKTLRGVSAMESVVQSHSSFKFGPFDARELILFRSELDPAGARHTPLRRAPLSGSRTRPAGGDSS